MIGTNVVGDVANGDIADKTVEINLYYSVPIVGSLISEQWIALAPNTTLVQTQTRDVTRSQTHRSTRGQQIRSTHRTLRLLKTMLMQAYTTPDLV